MNKKPHLRLHCRPTTVGDLPTKWHWCLREPCSGIRTYWQESSADAIEQFRLSQIWPYTAFPRLTLTPLSL